jgi:uncharacterized membrane protein
MSARNLNHRHCLVALAVILFCSAALVRITLALQPGLWVDEIFSLAMATGHSLEHPASAANPALGDFIEPPAAQPPSVFRSYYQHDSLPAGPKRVIRAVFLSDSNPPLYYLLLNIWTRAAGTGDAALRLFSTFWALACLPLIWFLGDRIEGKKTAWIACILFIFSPAALYYSAEGRMYSLLWFLALGLALSSFRIARCGPHPLLVCLWIISAAAGLLTHYFFIFVFMACFIWLVFHAGKMRRIQLIWIAALTGLLIFPWYVQIPESISKWRVTAGWLGYPLSLGEALTAPFFQCGVFFPAAASGAAPSGWIDLPPVFIWCLP